MKLCIFESLKGPPNALAVGFLSLRSVITAAKGFQLVNVRAVFAKPPFPTMGLLRQSALRRRNFCYWAGAVLPAAFQRGCSLLAGRGDRVAPDACVHAGRSPSQLGRAVGVPGALLHSTAGEPGPLTEARGVAETEVTPEGRLCDNRGAIPVVPRPLQLFVRTWKRCHGCSKRAGQ